MSGALFQAIYFLLNKSRRREGRRSKTSDTSGPVGWGEV